MSATYLKSFGADLSENKLFECISILLEITSTLSCWLLIYLAHLSAFVVSFQLISLVSAMDMFTKKHNIPIEARGLGLQRFSVRDEEILITTVVLYKAQ